jgi:hypothetical protein
MIVFSLARGEARGGHSAYGARRKNHHSSLRGGRKANAAIHGRIAHCTPMDCFVAMLLAMTRLIRTQKRKNHHSSLRGGRKADAAIHACARRIGRVAMDPIALRYKQRNDRHP